MIMMFLSGVRPGTKAALLWTLTPETTPYTGTHRFTPIPNPVHNLAPDLAARHQRVSVMATSLSKGNMQLQKSCARQLYVLNARTEGLLSCCCPDMSY